jgi:hypothetical protein
LSWTLLESGIGVFLLNSEDREDLDVLYRAAERYGFGTHPIDALAARLATGDEMSGLHCIICGKDLTPTPAQLAALKRFGNPLRREPCLLTPDGAHRVDQAEIERYSAASAESEEGTHD